MPASKTRKRSGSAESLYKKTAPPPSPPEVSDPSLGLVTISMPLLWQGYDALAQADQEVVQRATLEIRELHGEIEAAEERMASLFKMTVEKAIQIGERLTRVKDVLPHGQFLPWIRAEFPFSHDTASNYMKVSKRFSKDEISKVSKFTIPLSAFHVLADAPDSAIAEVTQRAEQGQPTSVAESKTISWRHRALEEAGVIPEARIQLGDAKIDDFHEMKRLGRLQQPVQLEAAARIAGGEPVRQVIRWAKHQTIDVPSEAVEFRPDNAFVQFERIEYRGRAWRDEIVELDPESVDLIFAETPLDRETLPNYQELAQECSRVLRKGGTMFCFVGHQNLQEVGTEIKRYLDIGWTFAARRRPGNSPRIIGLDIASSWVPVCVWYKSPWRRPDGLADDLRQAEDIHSSLETSVHYYLERFAHQTDTVVHLVMDSSKAFGLQSTFVDAVDEFNLGKLIGIGGV